MATKYLDNTGLAYFWGKIKSWVTSRGYITSSGSITGNAATATRLGTSTVGSSVQPIYLESGTATAVNSALRTCYGGVESEAVSNTYFKIGSGSITGTYNHLKVRMLVQHLTDGNSCIWDIWLCSGRTAGEYSSGLSVLLDSTGYYGTNLIVAYKSNSRVSLDFELYVKETARYSSHRFTVIQECWRNSQKVGNILTLYNQLTTTGTSSITSGYTALTTIAGTVGMNINGSSTSCSGNAATASAVAWSGVTNKPTTISGYGITDVAKKPIKAKTTVSSVVNANTAFTVATHTLNSDCLLVFVNGVQCDYTDYSATQVKFPFKLNVGDIVLSISFG